MVAAMDAEGFGNCTNTYECEAVCPAEISASFIAKLNREYARGNFRRSAGEWVDRPLRGRCYFGAVGA